MAIKHKCGHEIRVNDIQSSPCLTCRKPVVKRVMKDRLPDGCEKRLKWTGGVWVGELIVPGTEPFMFTAASEAKCFHGLDDLYREWLKGSQH